MKPEIWEERRQKVAECAYLGMSVGEAAISTGFTRPTIHKYAEKFGIKFADKPGRLDNVERVSVFKTRLQDITDCASQGMTRAETAKSLSIGYSTVVKYGLEHNIEFRHARVDLDRADAMAAMYRAGKTLEEIGTLYSLTRERVRQIITKAHGITAGDGGAAFKADISKAHRKAEREAKCWNKHGCSVAQLSELRRIGREAVDAGQPACKSPIQAFTNQRNSALRRGIEWNIKLWDWWLFWERSGKWEQRGRGHGYMMCRFADSGAYEIGNVYIATGVHNGSVQPNNPYRSDHPDFERAIAEKRARFEERRAAA